MAVSLIEHKQIELLLLISALQQHPSIKIDPTIDWNLFYTLVIRHRVWHQVLKALTHTHINTHPIPIFPIITKHCKTDKFRLLITANETVRIAEEFTKNAVEHCFIKGMLLNVYLYGSLDARPCRDIDVWIKLSDYPRALEALRSLGYKQKLPGYALSGFKQTYYMSHRHDMAFYHPERGILIEPHFRIDYFGINFFPWETLVRKPIQLLNKGIMTLEDDYHLLYLMIHGSIHAWIRLRWLQDIALFIQSNRCDLDNLMNLAKQIQCQHLVEQTLMLVNDLFTLNNTQLVTLIQNPSRRATQLATLSKQFIAGNFEMTDGFRNPKMFFKYRFYLAKLAVKGQKIHAVFGDLFKIDELFQYITFPDKLSFMYYLVYPVWVLKFIWKSVRN